MGRAGFGHGDHLDNRRHNDLVHHLDGHGVHRSIKYLGEINMVLAAVLLLFLLVVGPTVFMLNTFTESFGAYVSNLVTMSFRMAASGDEEWLAAYTLFY